MHIPVLLDEVLAALKPRKGATIVDATVGLAGHSAALLRKIMPGGKLIGLDLDPGNLEAAREVLQEVGGTFSLHHSNFAALPEILAGGRVNGLVADLGVASPHLDNPARGFSYRRSGPLDMRLDPTRGLPASRVLDQITEPDLAAALLELGDEDDAVKVAAAIVRARPIRTTEHLAQVVCAARDFTMQRAAGAKLHPAARTFQAIRILVNREMSNLDRLLAVLPDVLAPGGTAVIISFHSGEDRRVKKAFRAGEGAGVYSEVSPDPLMARDEERSANVRSRSAKLRWARLAK